VLREHDLPGAANIGLIDTAARFALDAGFHAVVEGILYADHRRPTHHDYPAVPFERNATKPIASRFVAGT
jgi:hypothetical protein